ncbi:hypothetical protein Poli38472_010226 [Pythium oligandrum]|uniref:Uncharacterized protein n=1 Tax=Pythium oligandrum TaxID=41045 RepID=A0A8K1FGG2_PYTOL|nr:hypothetical protein Poli38472_010226 [Pythium oligandrum]|eukprot:TMW58667.1 hypothetical protein Poli38472_010226 [Pythium oligandrum]
MERQANDDGGELEAEAEDAWQSFEQSVEYMNNLSALYRDAFLAGAHKKTVSASHLQAAKEHAREAIELLASNLLGVSTALLTQIENQEEALATVTTSATQVHQRIRDRERKREQQILARFHHQVEGIPMTSSDKSDPSVSSKTQPKKLKLPLVTASTAYLYY